MVLFTLSLRPGYALGALISDKINQWTLLVGALPLIYSFGAGSLLSLPLGPRQHEEFFLTAAQSVFAVALLLRLRFSLASAVVLLALFLAQLGAAFYYQADEAKTIFILTAFAWGYLALALAITVASFRQLIGLGRVAFLNDRSR
jgi:cation:H+ antiporter